jgi:hypothetical protein
MSMGLLFVTEVIHGYGEPRWNGIDKEKPKNSEKNISSATLSTTNLTWTDPGANAIFHGERPATNRLSHGTAQYVRPCKELLFQSFPSKIL